MYIRPIKTKKSIQHELLVVDILRTAHVVGAKLEQVHKSHGITSPQYNILRILRGARPEMLGVGEVKDRMVYSNSDVSRLLDRLVSKGLVDREVCPDNRRRMDVSISSEGLSLLDTLDGAMYDELDGFYHQVVSEERLPMMREELEKIAKATSKQ